MASSVHAILSASSSHRWLNCTRSVKLTEGLDDRPSEFALEGTEAHRLAEYRLKKALKMKADNPIGELKYYNEEMEDAAIGFVAFVLEEIERVKSEGFSPLVLIEHRVDFSNFVLNGFGTADVIIIAGSKITVIDFKYGKGIKVLVDDNSQLKLYLLGAFEAFDYLFDFDKGKMVIYQPRIGNVSETVVLKEDIYLWAKNVLAPAAELAITGKGEFKAGDWCQFCRVKNTCRKLAEENTKLAQFEFSDPPLLSDDEVEDIIGRVDNLVNWAEGIKDYALKQALQGKVWKAWKVVEGKSNRKYTDESAVAMAVKSAGFEPFEQKLLGLTDMQRLLGKKKFDELLSEFIIKPQGKPTLVPLSDKREPLNMTIKEEFKNVN